MLHIVYRSYGGENKKGRPSYYSKLLALVSTVRAFEELEKGSAELIFLNDGPIPPERLRVMERSGIVVAREKLGLRGSIKAGMALPVERGWKAEDLVWFAEDDYLYLPHSFVDLVKAAELYPQAAYFGLYAQIGDRLPSGLPTDEKRVPASWRDSDVTLVNGHPWRRALSTTSTFGARVGPLLEDSPMMDVAMLTGGAFDHTICLMYQGFNPYPGFALTDPLRSTRGAKDWLRQMAISTMRVGLNGYQAVRSLKGSPTRLLIAPEPALSTHLETTYLADGNDWEAAARSTQHWAQANGFT